MAAAGAPLRSIQAWMGHAHVGTTMRYIHHRDRGDEAKLLAEAFAPRNADPASQASRVVA